MTHTPIHSIQGSGLFSPFAGQDVTTRGVVIGSTRKGFFIQDPESDGPDDASRGIFVFRHGGQPQTGSLVEISGKVMDYQPSENSRPTTQLEPDSIRPIDKNGPRIAPVWLTSDNVLVEQAELAVFLNSLEGMLVGIQAGATFTAPSNPYGDYVVVPDGTRLARSQQGGVMIDPLQPERWLPGFRVIDYSAAPTVNVGAVLLKAVTGPLNFRVESYQIAAESPIRVRAAAIEERPTHLHGDDNHLTVLTLNGFNLDPHIEDPHRVKDPQRDVDDDIGEGRFRALGLAIARDAAGPAIVALQEIQDEDGAEMTDTVRADRTYEVLIAEVKRAGGPRYQWLDIPPVAYADGGQPGGNIRNAFLYDPRRVSYVEGTLKRLGEDSPAFVESRKPLAARFRAVKGPGEIEVINVHLASKRHQNGIFAPKDPGVDPRTTMRLEQAEIIGAHMADLRARGIDYYVTGDFNDFEFSGALRVLTGDHSSNLLESVPGPLRFDYNHRGISQALMHGIVANRQLAGRSAEYDILHANALKGTRPGRSGGKPSDHAYVIARLELGPAGLS